MNRYDIHMLGGGNTVTVDADDLTVDSESRQLLFKDLKKGSRQYMIFLHGVAYIEITPHPAPGTVDPGPTKYR